VVGPGGQPAKECCLPSPSCRTWPSHHDLSFTASQAVTAQNLNLNLPCLTLPPPPPPPKTSTQRLFTHMPPTHPHSFPLPCRGCPQDDHDRDPAHHEGSRYDHRRPTHHAAGGLHDVQGGGGGCLPASGLLVMFGTEAWQQQHMQPGRTGAVDRQAAELAALLAASLLCVDVLPASSISAPTPTHAY
jgi:hypothetical protein